MRFFGIHDCEPGRWRVRAVVISAVCAILFGLGGCDRDETDGKSSTSQPAADVRAAPQRIVTIAPNAAEMIAALGCADRLVGVSDFCVYPPELKTRPRVGGLMDPDLETITGLKPDLIVIRGSIQPVERLADRRGIRLFRDQTESFNDIFTTIESLGELLDRPEAAETLNDRLKRELAAVEKRVADKDRPCVLFIVNRDAEDIRNIVTFGRDTFVTEVIERAGGRGAFGNLDVPYPQVSVEEILAAKPDIIIEAIEARKMTPDLPEKMRDQWRRLKALPAVRNDRIHILTDDYLLIPSPRVVESVEKLAELIHPLEDQR